MKTVRRTSRRIVFYSSRSRLYICFLFFFAFVVVVELPSPWRTKRSLKQQMRRMWTKCCSGVSVLAWVVQRGFSGCDEVCAPHKHQRESQRVSLCQKCSTQLLFSFLPPPPPTLIPTELKQCAVHAWWRICYLCLRWALNRMNPPTQSYEASKWVEREFFASSVVVR